MSACTVRERLYNFGIGLVVALVLLGIGWPLTLFSWAAQ